MLQQQLQARPVLVRQDPQPVQPQRRLLWRRLRPGELRAQPDRMLNVPPVLPEAGEDVLGPLRLLHRFRRCDSALWDQELHPRRPHPVLHAPGGALRRYLRVLHPAHLRRRRLPTDVGLACPYLPRGVHGGAHGTWGAEAFRPPRA